MELTNLETLSLIGCCIQKMDSYTQEVVDGVASTPTVQRDTDPAGGLERSFHLLNKLLGGLLDQTTKLLSTWKFILKTK